MTPGRLETPDTPISPSSNPRERELRREGCAQRTQLARLMGPRQGSAGSGSAVGSPLAPPVPRPGFSLDVSDAL